MYLSYSTPPFIILIICLLLRMGGTYSKTLGVSFLVQYVCFFFAAILKTDKFFDLAGSLTTIGIVLYNYLKGSQSFQHRIQTGFILAWAIRLGSYLFSRALLTGDWRLEKAKRKPIIFFFYWTLQGLWIFLNLLPTLSMQEHTVTLVSRLEIIGWSLSGVGILLETAADVQKFIFRLKNENDEKWLDSGMYSIIRYPNYLGEILHWSGMFVSASSSFTTKWEYLTVVSPLFVALLLTRISGIPLLETRNYHRFRENPQYKTHIGNTYLLIPYIY